MGRHLVAKYVTNAELQGRPPNWEVSIEGRHKNAVQPSYFNQERARPGQHLVAKYVTNAEPHGRPPYWGSPTEIKKHSLLKTGVYPVHI